MAFARMIDSMRFDNQYLPLSELVDHVTTHSGLMAHYQADKEGADRIENLNELVNAARCIHQIEGHATDASAAAIAEDNTVMSPLAGFLSHAALEAGDNQAQAGQDAVQLMTVHAAKGLEFDTVFVLGLEEGLFPHENSLSDEGGVERTSLNVCCHHACANPLVHDFGATAHAAWANPLWHQITFFG